MDTKEKVRGFIISKIASVINGLTDTISRDMNLNNIEHMKLKESLTSITDKHLDNLHKELEVLFKQDSNEEAVTSNGIYVVAPAVWPDPVNTKDLSVGTQYMDQNTGVVTIPSGIAQASLGSFTGEILNAPWKPESTADAITKEQIDEQQPKKHKCSSGSRLDELEARFKELEAEITWLKQRSHIHAFPPIVKKDYNHG